MKVALFANHAPGKEIAQFFATRLGQDIVAALYLVDDNAENDQHIVQSLQQPNTPIFRGKDIIQSADHVNWFRAQAFDAIVCVYWPWLLKPEVFNSVSKTVNFHPALLPINRGWFPHVHSLIDGSPTGVTLHQISDTADTGPIWAQKEVRIEATDTAKEIYERLQVEIVDLFKTNWDGICNGSISGFPQDESQAVYHAKKEIETLDAIDWNGTYKASDLINKLRARSFGKRGFAYYDNNGERVYLKISLSKSSAF